MTFAIIIVGYNRPDSIARLLKSVENAEYMGDKVDLIVSIDKGQKQSEIVSVAEKFNWKYGEKKIRAFGERQGLRKHIIQCGDLTDDYDAVIVLEDDLAVSPFFYVYAKQSAEFYNTCELVAGISLYKHHIHPGVNRPFEPVNNGYDTYFMQFAQSWGQCWTKTMWTGFREWYAANEDTDLKEKGILPDYIAGWNKQSWLKYYMCYIVEQNKYFVYPQISLTTNFSDVGEHCNIMNNDFQVAMLQGMMEFRMASFEKAIKYDVYFERQEIEVFTSLNGKKILDLYGNRSNYDKAEYLVSTRRLPYKVIDSIRLRYRPIEMNCITPSEGSGIYIYKLNEKAKKPKYNMNILTRFDTKNIHWKRLLRLGFLGLKNAVLSRISR